MADKTRCFGLKWKLDGKDECAVLKETYCRVDGGFDYSLCRFYKTKKEFEDGQEKYPPLHQK